LGGGGGGLTRPWRVNSTYEQYILGCQSAT